MEAVKMVYPITPKLFKMESVSFWNTLQGMCKEFCFF